MMYFPSLRCIARMGGWHSCSRSFVARGLFLRGRETLPLWNLHAAQVFQRLRCLSEVYREPTVDIAHAQETPYLGSGLGEDGLLDGLEVLLVHTQAPWPHYMAEGLHPAAKEVALLCVEGDPMLPE